MPNTTSLDDLLEFLTHAGERGLMPTATAQALAVASRNVFGVLDDKERAALPTDDLDGVIKRFTNKRAKEFNPTSLKEYGNRVKRAVEMHARWREDPANFSVKTRNTTSSRKRERSATPTTAATAATVENVDADAVGSTITATGYQSAFPIRPGHVVTIGNIPYDLSKAEADRLSQFFRLLAPV